MGLTARGTSVGGSFCPNDNGTTRTAVDHHLSSSRQTDPGAVKMARLSPSHCSGGRASEDDLGSARIHDPRTRTCANLVGQRIEVHDHLGRQ